MAKSENSFAITAFVATEPQVRNFTNNAKAEFAISVATADKDGNRKSALLNVEVWNKNADFAAIAKGKRLTFKGFLRPDEWTEKDGKQRSKVAFVVTSVTDPAAETE